MINNGIDMVNIKRFKQLIENDKFMNKNFNKNELEYIKHNISTLAGIFASKEATLKAIKKGIDNYSLKDIEVIHDDHKAPSLIFHNNLSYLNDKNLSLSISHDGEYAIAMVSIID